MSSQASIITMHFLTAGSHQTQWRRRTMLCEWAEQNTWDHKTNMQHIAMQAKSRASPSTFVSLSSSSAPLPPDDVTQHGSFLFSPAQATCQQSNVPILKVGLLKGPSWDWMVKDHSKAPIVLSEHSLPSGTTSYWIKSLSRNQNHLVPPSMQGVIHFSKGGSDFTKTRRSRRHLTLAKQVKTFPRFNCHKLAVAVESNWERKSMKSLHSGILSHPLNAQTTSYLDINYCITFPRTDFVKASTLALACCASRTAWRSSEVPPDPGNDKPIDRR